jgi:hypothetical protein
MAIEAIAYQSLERSDDRRFFECNLVLDCRMYRSMRLDALELDPPQAMVVDDKIDTLALIKL